MSNNKFSFDINKVLQNTIDKNVQSDNIDNDEVNNAMNIANEIIDVFSKYKIELADAYLILTSLADAIYLYSVTRDK